MEIDFAFTLAGFVVGLVVGLTGIGGGALMTPILVLGFGVPMVTAVGTDLVYAAVTKGTGVWVYARKSMVDWKVVFALLSGSFPGTLVALWSLSWIPLEEVIHNILHVTLSIALILSSLALLFRPYLQSMGTRWERGSGGAIRIWLTAIMGFVLGVLVTLSSVGAGALGTALLVLLYPQLSVPAIVGTDLAHAVMLAGMAGLGHLRLGTVDFSLLASLLLGSLPGVYLGSHCGVRLPERIVRPAVASVLFLVGVRLVV